MVNRLRHNREKILDAGLAVSQSLKDFAIKLDSAECVLRNGSFC